MDNLRGRGLRRAEAKTAFRSHQELTNFVSFWRLVNDDRHNQRLAFDQKRAQPRRQSSAQEEA